MNKTPHLNHIYCFSFYNNTSPSTRYRASIVLAYLESHHKVSYSLVYPGYTLRAIISFIFTYMSVLFFRKNNSLIIFQKIYTKGVYATLLKLLLRLRRAHTVYDMDDAEYLRFAPDTIIYFLRHCTAAFLGSQELVRYASSYNKNTLLLTSPVTYVSNVKKTRNKLLTIGWIGDYGTGKTISKEYSHKTSLKKLLLPALLDLPIPVKIIIAGVHTKADRDEIIDYLACNKNIIVEIPMEINWMNEVAIHNLIKQFDIGVSPMVDHEFNRAKSAFKLKQYFSCGVPALVSAVGENTRFLIDGENGFICSTPAEFNVKIQHIYKMSEEEYTSLSNNALKSQSQFNLENYSGLIQNYYKTNANLS